MESVGSKLRKARENKNISLDKVYKDTKIHPNVLNAIEEDRAEETLNSVYIKGFLKKYSQYLGLDSESIINEYFSRRPYKAQPVPVLKEKKHSRAINYPRHPFFLFRILLILLLTIGFIGYIYLAFKSVFRPWPHKKVKIETTKTRPPQVVRRNVVKENKEEQLNLIVKSKDDSWIQVKSDGKIIFQDILKKGKIEQWNAKEKIELWVGNAEGLDLELNGNPLGSIGRGVVKDILITKTGVKIKKR